MSHQQRRLNEPVGTATDVVIQKINSRLAHLEKGIVDLREDAKCENKKVLLASEQLEKKLTNAQAENATMMAEKFASAGFHTEECFGTLKFVTDNHLSQEELKKLVDQKKHQARDIVAYYEEHQKMDPVGLKAMLTGINAAKETHDAAQKRRERQQQQMKTVYDHYDNKLNEDGRYTWDRPAGLEERLDRMVALQAEAVANRAAVEGVLEKQAPLILEQVAVSIKRTAGEYDGVFESLHPETMQEIREAVDALRPADVAASKRSQPPSRIFSHPELQDQMNPLFLVGLLADALGEKVLLDAIAAEIAAACGDGAKSKPAPIKNIERAIVKVLEKYGLNFSSLTDLARATIECKTEQVLLAVLRKLKEVVQAGKAHIVRIKHRLDDTFEALEFGGYRDILINLSFSDGGHIVELQLNLAAFVHIKGKGGGHLAYGTARMLQAFESDTTAFMGRLDADSSRDVGTGLLKKASIVGLESANALSVFSKSSVQLVELKLMNVDFGAVGVSTLDWLAQAAEPLAVTLKVLEVSGCKGIEGQQMPSQLGKLVKLKELRMNDNNLQGQIPNWLENLKGLKVLNLSSNNFEGQIPESLGNCTKLTVLYLGNNKLEGQIPNTLGNCKELKYFNLDRNQFTGEIPVSMGNCTKLESLLLGGNNLTGEIPSSLEKCVNLTELELHTNQLTGPIPVSLGNCTKLVRLELQRNKLTGEIPNSLGNCTKLIWLRLDTNQLTGPIPESLGNCAKLTKLILWENQLTGEIPVSLGNCVNLRLLRLDENNLTGTENAKALLQQQLPNCNISV